MNDLIVWVDCEMTGLDLRHDALVEVAALVTDGDLNVLGTGVEVVIKPPAESLDTMPDVVRDMHTESGLLDLLPSGITLDEAQGAVLSYVREFVPVAGKAPLGGNSVFVDRGFLARDMPELEQHLHYRCVDVSAIKELVRRWYPKVYYASPAKTGNHRALGDIQESVNELKHYLSFVSVPNQSPPKGSP
jgi:oligoribonuclease